MRYRTQERLKKILIIVLFIGALTSAVVIILNVNNNSSRQNFVDVFCNSIIGDYQVKEIDMQLGVNKTNSINYKIMNKDNCYQFITSRGNNELYRVIVDSEFNIYIRIDEIIRQYIEQSEGEVNYTKFGIEEEYGKKYIKFTKDEVLQYLGTLGIDKKIICNLMPQYSKALGYARTSSDINSYGDKGIISSFKYGYNKYMKSVINEALKNNDINIESNYISLNKKNKGEVLWFVNSFYATCKDIDTDLNNENRTNSLLSSLSGLAKLLNDSDKVDLADIINEIVYKMEYDGKFDYGVSFLLDILIDSYKNESNNDGLSKAALIFNDKLDVEMSIKVLKYSAVGNDVTINFNTIDSNKVVEENKINITSRAQINSIIVIPDDSECCNYITLSGLVNHYKNGEELYGILQGVVESMIESTIE